MNKNSNYEGQCFCGVVQFELISEPEVMAYCHCDSCRQWSAGPVNAFTLWGQDDLKIIQGAEHIAAYDGNPGRDETTVMSIRQWCTKCGGHLFTVHPTMGLIDVPAAVIQNFPFNPGFHVHYQESVHHIQDGLPKFVDLPKEAGGSGLEYNESE